MPAKYPQTRAALRGWARWLSSQWDGAQEWSPDSVLATVIRWGIVPGAGASASTPLAWQFERDEQRTHYAVQQLQGRDSELARVICCHYLVPGDADARRRTWFPSLSQRRYFDRLDSAVGWLDGALVGMGVHGGEG